MFDLFNISLIYDIRITFYFRYVRSARTYCSYNNTNTTKEFVKYNELSQNNRRQEGSTPHFFVIDLQSILVPCIVLEKTSCLNKMSYWLKIPQEIQVFFQVSFSG